MRALLAMLAAIALSAATAAGAATVSRTFDGVVTERAGGRLSSGIASALSPGAPVRIDLFVEIADPFANIFGDDFAISVSFPGNGANALIQPCCISGVDDDPADGTVGLDGGLGGFTGPEVPGYFLSAADFDLVFRSTASPFPGSFATAGDAAAFLEDMSITVSGFVRADYVADGTDPGAEDFDQRISFATSVPAVPLPAAVWLLGAGMLALGGFRRRHAG